MIVLIDKKQKNPENSVSVSYKHQFASTFYGRLCNFYFYVCRVGNLSQNHLFVLIQHCIFILVFNFLPFMVEYCSKK